MGAYLSKPVTDKISSDESNETLAYGASSMQGWRVYQEDAHNAILNFGKSQSLFAVYDGHGGHEVATYTAAELPNFIKSTDTYNQNQFLGCLSEAFLEFDATLVEPEVLAILKDIAGSKDQEDSDYEGDEIDYLCREASMPLEEVMAKYTEDCSHFPSPMIMKPKKVGCNSSSEEGCSSKLILNESFDETDSSLNSTLTSSVLSEEDNETHTFCPHSSIELTSGSSLHNGTSPLESSSTALEHKKTIDLSEKINQQIEISEQKRINDEGGGTKELGAELENDENGGGGAKELGAELKNDVNEGGGAKEAGMGLDSDVNGDERAKAAVAELDNDINGPSSDNEQQKIDMEVNGSLKEEKDLNELSEAPCIGGKGKGAGKGKGKSLMNHAIVQAMKEVQRRALKRKAAQKAEEIYKQIQHAQQSDLSDEDDDDEDEEEGDENFNGEGYNHGLVDNSSSEEEDSENEEEEDEEEEENEGDDSQYNEFAMNMREEPGYDSGCTACVALLHERELFVANVGDSRCVVNRGGKALDMSIDHKPEDEIESERITTAGGRITSDGRVNGGLNLSRALGDHSYKQNKNLRPEEQMISPFPDVRCLTLTPEDSFFVIACDGIWNSMTSQEVCDFVSERLKPDTKLSTIAEQIFDHCLSPDAHGDGTGCDNMTCIIIKLNTCSQSCDLGKNATTEKCDQKSDSKLMEVHETSGTSLDSNIVKVCEANTESELAEGKEININSACEGNTESTCEPEASDELSLKTGNMCDAMKGSADPSDKVTEIISDTESRTVCKESEGDSSGKACEPITSIHTNPSEDNEICKTTKQLSEETDKKILSKVGCESVKRGHEATSESTDDEGHIDKRSRQDIG